jgi:hypothetical protein
MTIYCPKCKKLWDEKDFKNNQTIENWCCLVRGVRCECGAGIGSVVWVTDLESLKRLEGLSDGD